MWGGHGVGTFSIRGTATGSRLPLRTPPFECGWTNRCLLTASTWITPDHGTRLRRGTDPSGRTTVGFVPVLHRPVLLCSRALRRLTAAAPTWEHSNVLGGRSSRTICRAAARAAGGLLLCVTLLGCSRKAPVVTVAIDARVRFQSCEGFGTSLIGWQQPMRDYYATEDFRRLYLTELGASVLRVDLHGDAVPEREDWRELSHRDFVLDGPGARAAAYLHTAAALHAASDGELRIIASVWTPPAWMKENGRLGKGRGAPPGGSLTARDLGLEEASSTDPPAPRSTNRLRADRYRHFAKSLVEWTRLYAAAGAPLFALSPQNEPRFSHWFESSVYTPSELARLTEVIVETFRGEGVELPRLFVPETMSHDVDGNRAYLDALFASRAAPNIHAIAGHGYVDGYRADSDPAAPGHLFELARRHGRPAWITEGGSGDHAWPAPIHELGSSLMNALIGGRASLVATWQVVDGVLNEHALRALPSPSKKLAVASHFFRYLRPGMTRILAASSEPGVQVVAYASPQPGARPNSSIVLVVLNRTQTEMELALSFADERERKLRSKIVTSAQMDRQADSSHKLPPESVSTIAFE